MTLLRGLVKVSYEPIVLFINGLSEYVVPL